jgi:hypothetical protein
MTLRSSHSAVRDRRPKSCIGRLLDANPPVGGSGPRPDLRRQIIEHQIPVFGADHQDEMMFAAVGNHLAQQQRPRWPSAIEQFVSF